MSYDVKYIGMDVHKEAVVIAVLNDSGNDTPAAVALRLYEIARNA